MALGFVWMVPVLLVLVLVAAGVLVLVVLRRERRLPTTALPIAHGERLTELPHYRRLMVRYRLLLAALLVLLLTAVGAAGLLAARPVGATVVNPEQYNRDIMLCLDVSGSMVEYDVEVLRFFEKLSTEFKGERVGLVLWDSSAVQVFPLSDDYDYVSTQLTLLRKSMSDWEFESPGYNSLYWVGTDMGEGASLIGDGLASCVMGFDRTDTKRSRSIVFATDNMLNGDQLVSLVEAGEFAALSEVRVYAMTPDIQGLDAERDELEQVALATDGGFGLLGSPGAVQAITARVLAEQASALPGMARLLFHDMPLVPLVFAYLAVCGFLVLGWRLRR